MKGYDTDLGAMRLVGSVPAEVGRVILDPSIGGRVHVTLR